MISVVPKPFGNGLCEARGSFEARESSYFGVKHGTLQGDAKKIPILPHAIHFPGHKLSNFLFQAGGERQMLRQLDHSPGNTRTHHGQQQSFLALEVAMDEALRTASAGGNFPRGCRFISMTGEEL